VLKQIDSYQTPTNFGEGANYWSNNFFVIAQTNLILDNELTETNRVIFGEAYFLRALSYFNLVRAFGRVPYVNRFIQFREEVTEFPQIESAEMYANIASDFQNAIELLSGLDNSERPRNRASEGAAKILLAKAYLSQPEPNYPAARDLLEEFIPENNAFKYTLLDNYTDVFSRNNELNDEIIFAITYELSNSDDFITSDSNIQDQIQTESESFSFAMTLRGASNGVNLATEDLKNFISRRRETNRLNAIFFEGAVDNEDAENGKWITSGNRSQRAGDVDWIVLRYSDALLLYVEAILGDGLQTNDLDAVDAYNRVRVRAGFPTLADDISITEKVITKQSLLDERRAEFAFENQRLYDLIRFKEAINVLTDHSNDPVNDLNFSPRDLLLPIPQREIDATNNFYEQNFGYQ